MTHAIRIHNMLTGFWRLAAHAAVTVLGLVMMIVGLALGVTMIMLPVGVVVGLAGVAMVVIGLFARLDEPTR